MYKSIILILSLSFALACSNDQNVANHIEIEEQTPEVLAGDESDIKSSSFRIRSNYDIVEQLFEEAMNKDENLMSLNKRIEEVEDLKADSLEAYRDYIQKNQNYWHSLSSYANQLSDSTLKRDLNVLISTLKEKHDKKVLPLNSVVAQIDSNKRVLRDYEILMKIIVTEPMMSNYQRNEYPKMQTLKSVKNAYDSLIIDVKPFAQIKK
jgi:hypothetical protein